MWLDFARGFGRGGVLRRSLACRSSELGATGFYDLADTFQIKRGKTIVFICPWCGTNYLTFQTNCGNCGGPLLSLDQKNTSSFASEDIPSPPLVPRPISTKYAWRLLFTDGWSIGALVFCLLGVIFALVGAALTLGVVTAFVGTLFYCLGLHFLE
jgi:hypothetical protein